MYFVIVALVTGVPPVTENAETVAAAFTVANPELVVPDNEVIAVAYFNAPVPNAPAGKVTVSLATYPAPTVVVNSATVIALPATVILAVADE